MCICFSFFSLSLYTQVTIVYIYTYIYIQYYIMYILIYITWYIVILFTYNIIYTSFSRSLGNMFDPRTFFLSLALCIWSYSNMCETQKIGHFLIFWVTFGSGLRKKWVCLTRFWQLLTLKQAIWLEQKDPPTNCQI